MIICINLYDYHVIQADETPVLVTSDGRSCRQPELHVGVYRSGFMYRDRQIILCEYQKTRNVIPSLEIRGITPDLCRMGTSISYIEKEREDLKIAGLLGSLQAQV